MTLYPKVKGCIFLACFLLFFLLWLLLQITNASKKPLKSKSLSSRTLLKFDEPVAQYHRQAKQWSNGGDQHNDQYDEKNSSTRKERIKRYAEQCDDWFTCSNGAQICKPYLCDDIPHCSYEEDEESCECKYKSCDNGKMCFTEDHVCDEIEDCIDKEDEQNCPTTSTIPPIISTPPSTKRTCRLDSSLKLCSDNVTYACYCDKFEECPGKEDEDNCEQVLECQSDQVTCGDGSCVEKSALCDGSPQCPDGSDELNCPTTCRSDQLTCGDGSCLEQSARCDGSPQCSDNSDELDCPTTCNDNEWMCLDGTCIPLQQRCNYVYNCLDCSDEENCPGYWRCRDGFFITDRKRCDGRYDCYDGSDETHCWYLYYG